jgi:hypothetical protein
MRTLLAALALILTPAVAWSQNHGQCPCHAGGGQCVCQPASRCPNCPPQGRAAPAYRTVGYDSRLVQVQPGVRVVLACAPPLRVDVIQQAPVLQIRVDQPRMYVVETPIFIEPPVFLPEVRYSVPQTTVIRQRTYTPPVYQLPSYSRTVIRCRT